MLKLFLCVYSCIWLAIHNIQCMFHIALLISKKMSKFWNIPGDPRALDNGMWICIDFLLSHTLFPLHRKFNTPSPSFLNWQSPYPKCPNLNILFSVKYSLTFLSIISHVLIRVPMTLNHTHDSSFYTTLWPLCAHLSSSVGSEKWGPTLPLQFVL